MTGISRNSVANYIKSYVELESTLAEVLNLSDADFAQLFISNKPLKPKKYLDIIHPDWNVIHEELSKKGMARHL